MREICEWESDWESRWVREWKKREWWGKKGLKILSIGSNG